jgi:hypothetical protein
MLRIMLSALRMDESGASVAAIVASLPPFFEAF